MSVRCYGWGGPWFNRGGFDMLGSAASGLAMLEGAKGAPSMPPTALINDYITGYMGAAGATAALLKRARQGGSYHVTVSLTRCAMWYQSLGLVPEAERSFARNHIQDIWALSQSDRSKATRDLGLWLFDPSFLIRDTRLGRFGAWRLPSPIRGRLPAGTIRS